MLSFVVLLASIVPAQTESKPDAQQLAAWLADLASGDTTKQQAARLALLKAGPRAKDAVPALIKLLGNNDSKRTWASHIAVELLGAIGPAAKDAIPALAKLCTVQTYGGSSEAAALSIAKIDGPTQDLTRILLLSSNKGTPILIAGSAYLTENKTAVAKHLLALCDDESPMVRQKALLVLIGKRGYRSFDDMAKVLVTEVGETPKAVATFSKLLADKDPVVRLIAAHGLAKTAPKEMHKAIPVVIALMCEVKPKDHLEWYPTQDIFRPIPTEATKALLPLFDGADTGRTWAISVLSQLPVQDAIITTLRDGTTARTREAAALCLGVRYRYDRSTAHPALKGALKDSDFRVRFASAAALIDTTKSDEQPPADGVFALTEGLANEAADMRVQAAKRLAQIGPRAASAATDLKKCLDDREPRVALAAALAFAIIAPKEAAPTLPVLRNSLKHSKELADTLQIARVLGRLGPVAKPAVPELTARLEAKEEPRVRIEAAEALALIEAADSAKATAVLVEVFQKNHGAPHDAALVAMAHLGLAATSALPALLDNVEQLQKKPHSYISNELVLAIMSVDPAAPETVRRWIRETMANDEHREVVSIGWTYKQLRQRAKPIMQDLIKTLDAKPAYLRICATALLGDIGSDAQEALPMLQALASKDSNELVRKLASDAVRYISRK